MVFRQSQFPSLCRYSLLLGLLLLAACNANAQSVIDTYRLRFPLTQSAQVFTNQPAPVNVSFEIYFPIDEKRYLPIRDELARSLGAQPEVTADRGLHVRVLRTVCTPQRLTVEMGDQ